MSRSTMALVLAGALALPAAARAAEPGWLHVQVNEGGADGSKVDVQLPLSLMDVALRSMDDGKLRAGRVRLDHSDADVTQMRRAWRELKAAGDMPFVVIEQKDESVRVERLGERVLVTVSDKLKSRQKVRVEVPTLVIDALFSGDEDSLNIAAAVSALRTAKVGELIRVDDGDSRVRIWLE